VPGSAGTLETIARHIGLALQPLEDELTSQNLIPFLANLGLQFPPQLTAPGPFMTAVQQTSAAAGALPNLLTQLAADIRADNAAAIVEDGLKIVQQIAAVIAGLEAMGN